MSKNLHVDAKMTSLKDKLFAEEEQNRLSTLSDREKEEQKIKSSKKPSRKK